MFLAYTLLLFYQRWRVCQQAMQQQMMQQQYIK